jgi:hypothetical protein
VELDRAALEGLRQMILADGAGQLAAGDLRDDDLACLGWWGNPAQWPLGSSGRRARRRCLDRPGGVSRRN